MRGYFGIGIENCKTEQNVGTLWRSAHNLGASFIFTIGRRYAKQCSDTTKAWKSIPLFEYGSLADFASHSPRDCQIVGVEFPHDDARSVVTFPHPERCVYLLGAEDHGLTKRAVEMCHHLVYIPSKHCLNVAAAGTIIMYDRMAAHSRPGVLR